MSNQHLVSVIVPVYNVRNFLEECLDSIIEQSYKNIEVILVDDGSTDTSGAICDTYCKKNKNFKVIHQKNAGLSAARNSGIDIARGEYITFIDSDDWIDETFIETLLLLIQQYNSDISIVGRYLEYTNKTISKNDNNLYIMNSEECLEKILYSNKVDNSACGKLYKKHLFTNSRYPVGKEFEDTIITCELVMKSSKITLQSIPLYHYRKNSPGSITHSKFSEKKLDLIELANTLASKTTKTYPNLKKACNRFLAHSYLSILARAIDNHYDKSLLRELMANVKKQRINVILDKNTPKNDKIALLSTFFGYKCYYTLWKSYTKKENE